MSLIESLALSAADTGEVRGRLLRTFHTAVANAESFATLALEEAAFILEVAEEGGAMAEVYSSFTNVPKFLEQGRLSFEAATDVMALLCAISESPDDMTNMAYSDHLQDMLQGPKIAALMNAANVTLQVAMKAVPANPLPGAHFDPGKLKSS